MTSPKLRSVSFFWRPDNRKAQLWAQKLQRILGQRRIAVTDTPRAGQPVFVLGGDGTILEAVHRFYQKKPLIVGLNLGSVGFLASVRDPKKFIGGVKQILNGKYWVTEKILLEAVIERDGQRLETRTALNEILIQNPLGMTDLEARIDGHPIQKIRGTGALVATPTGSTAYNLSAHGPIVSPQVRAIIFTEILDHNIPSPSIVTHSESRIDLVIKNFRQRGTLSLAKNHEPFDVLLTVDGEAMMPLQKHDIVRISRAKHVARFVELEQHYFFKSLQEKLSFR